MSTAKIALAKRLFYLAAFISLALSVTLFFVLGKERTGIFVGLWVPSILSFGNLVLNGEQAS
ncbi:MAG: hypothetical protein WCI50_09700 [Actinomycetes bacterium]|jgi:hypothetical protein